MEPNFDHYSIFEKELKRRREVTKPLNVYKILQKITIPVAIEKLKKGEITSKRFASVMKLGECCVVCGLKRDYVAQGKDNGNSLHWDLYAADGTMMTIDHILPKSKGGKDEIENYQLMCAPCNHQKDNFVDVEQINKLVQEILSQNEYKRSLENEKFLAQYLTEVQFRSNDFSKIENQFIKSDNAYFLLLKNDEAKALRKVNDKMVVLLHEFSKRLVSNWPNLKSVIDYEIGKVYIIKE